MFTYPNITDRNAKAAAMKHGKLKGYAYQNGLWNSLK